MAANLHPVVWIGVILVIVGFWPLAQRLRHEKLRPVAAYLLFTSTFALVGGAVFMLLVLAAGALLSRGTMSGMPAAAIVAVLAFGAGLAAARRIVRNPQIRRMPR